MDECPICMENLKFNNRKIHTTDCNHKFHAMCFSKVKGGACPCCRAVIPQGISMVISNIKKEIKDVKYALKCDKKLAKDMLSEKYKISSTLRKKEEEAKKLLSARLKVVVKLENGLFNDFDTAVWISTQEDLIRNMEKERKDHFFKVLLIQSEYPRMIEFYSDILSKKTELLEEAQQKKLNRV